MNWKVLFEPKILKRGYSYFHDRAVVDFNVTEEIITATVNGTELYDVEIHPENDEIKEMYCSCPYAKDGKNCKHMAAVLYKWDFIKEHSKVDVAAVINQADEADIRRFLVEVIGDDHELLNKFMSQSQTAPQVEEKIEYVVPVYEEHKEQEHKELDYYSKFYPHKVIAIKELRLDTGMGLAEAKCEIDELFSRIEADNARRTGNTYVENNKYSTTSNFKPEEKQGDGSSFRLLHLKFWIVITGLIVFESAIGIIHPEIDIVEAIIMLLIFVPILVFLLKRHKYLNQYFDSEEYKSKKEEKKRLKAEKQRQKYEEQQRKARVYRASSHTERVSEQNDSGSGCCLVALFLLIFYAPIRVVGGLVKKHY